ncbi:MAG: hypothetical protein Q9178_003600 [Gyalolechia marmorata]
MPTLGRYLSTILDVKGKEGRIRFKENPQLDSSRTNIILVYYGSFNPPHRGHLAVLWHAYGQLSRHLNIVAALIRPTRDDKVRDKYRQSKIQPLVIPLHDRARLWEEDAQFPPWAWVFTESEGGCSALKKKLKALARKDQCRIRFANLCGPDCTPTEDFAEMTIISNIAREAKYDRQGVIEDFCQHGFGPWVVDEEQRAAQQQQPDQQACDDDLGLDLKLPTGDLSTQLAQLGSPRSVSVCWQKHTTPWKSLRFLRSTAEQNTSFRGISSSGIHTLIHQATGNDDELRAALEPIALSPGLLWDILAPTRVKRREQKTDVTLNLLDHIAIPAPKAQSVVPDPEIAAPAQNVTTEGKRRRAHSDPVCGRGLRKRQKICYKCLSQSIETTCAECRDWRLGLDSEEHMEG